VRISLDGRKAEGEWASFNEFIGKGDGKRTIFETPWPAKETRHLHVMRDFQIVSPGNIRRILDPDGNLLRDEPDGYDVTSSSPDAPLTITFQQPPGLNVRISGSILGRKPEKGEALKILPMTDAISRALDEKIPPELRKRKREETAKLPAVQEMYREAWNRLVVDFHGFTDENGSPHVFSEPVKKAILNELGALFAGGFAWDRANVIQQEKQAGATSEAVD
jgi:hypothetical protein